MGHVAIRLGDSMGSPLQTIEIACPVLREENDSPPLAMISRALEVCRKERIGLREFRNFAPHKALEMDFSESVRDSGRVVASDGEVTSTLQKAG